MAATRNASKLGPSGARLWRAVTGDFALEEPEFALLRSACHVADLIDALQAVVTQDGPLGADGKAHPAAVESRQQCLVLARLLASLRIPDADDEPESHLSPRPQRRGAARGSYGGTR